MYEGDHDTEWWELRLKPHPGLAIAAAEKLLELSPAGLVEAGDELLIYLPEAGFARRACLDASMYGLGRLRPIRESAWRRWRLSFRPVAAGERLWVVPLCDAGPGRGLDPAGPGGAGAVPGGPRPAPAGADRTVQVLLEPGLAFGTGEHPTTAACLRYLDRIVRTGDSVLDVGTGSGILAIAAALLGAERVLAVDVDPLACRAAWRNLALNPRAGGRVEIAQANAIGLLGPAARQAPPPADIVTANLTSALLRLLAGGFGRVTRAGGWLVASGLSWDNRPQVEAALTGAGFVVSGRTLEAGWVTILARRKEA